MSTRETSEKNDIGTYGEILLSLARQSIRQASEEGKVSVAPDKVLEALGLSRKNLPAKLKSKKGTFVTLTKDDELRGCIGHIEPVQPVYIDVVDNACSAAFKDPRFPIVAKSELDSLKIEVSLLTVPKRLSYKNMDELLRAITPEKHGVIISKGAYSSTFLPQVWEQLPKKEDFLSHLCVKAGLHRDEWRLGMLEVSLYKVEKISW